MRLVLLGFSLVGLMVVAGQVWGWQDLAKPCVVDQLKVIADPASSADLRRKAIWMLASVNRAAVHPLGEAARQHPDLAWTAVGLLDLIRTDAEVVRLFSAWLDAPPGGLKSTGEVAGFLSSRLEDMLGRGFRDAAERRAWVKENAAYLVYDPTRFVFVVDPEAKRKRQPRLHYPYAPSDHPLVDTAFHHLILALHVGDQAVVRALVGPEVSLVREGGRVDTRPALDLDAFASPASGQRAQLIRDEGKGRWLVRTASAYFFFEGDPPKCVKAGMKPIE